jgi:hypothetical protein
MKKFFILFFILIIFSISSLAINFDIGMSILTSNIENNFNMALRTGINSENFLLSFDFSPNFEDGISLISITEISAKLIDFSEQIRLDMGILWLNDQLFIPGETEDDEDIPVSSINLNLGITYFIENFYGKLFIMYPLWGNFEETLDLTNYLALKVGYIVPKPQNFKDDLIVELRLSKYRIDLSLFLSTPIG